MGSPFVFLKEEIMLRKKVKVVGKYSQMKLALSAALDKAGKRLREVKVHVRYPQSYFRHSGYRIVKA